MAPAAPDRRPRSGPAMGLSSTSRPPDDTPAADISIAVCTRDRARQLERALRSLTEQSRGAAEILVVDNAPSDDTTRRLVEEVFPGARYVREEIAGLDFARNRALTEATGRVVAFIDDDAVADPDWVAAIEQVFRDDASVGACSGRIDPLSLETAGQRLFEANGGLFAGGDERLRVPSGRYRFRWHRHVPMIAWAAGSGSGCNLAVCRDLALQLGGFDEALDLGPVLAGGGDNDMIWRILESGHEVVYEPGARVLHEHRRETHQVVQQILGHQRALVALATKAVSSASGLQRIPVFLFLVWRLTKPGVRLVRRALGRDPLPMPLLLRIWWHCWLGLGAYAEGVRVAQRRNRAASSSSRPVPGATS